MYKRQWLDRNKVKPIQAMNILKDIRCTYNEVLSAYNKEDEQLVEGYDFMKRVHLHRFVEFLGKMTKDANKYIKKVKPKRPVRKASLESMVKKLPYMRKFDELSVKSINPTDILGSTSLFVYNTASKLICVYQPVVNDLSGLSVKGASIIGYDPSRSFIKKCRNPEHTINMIKTLAKVHVLEHIEDIKTVKKEIRPRLNKNCIILRAF